MAPLLFGKDNFTCNPNNLSMAEAGSMKGMHFTAHLGSVRNRKQMVLAAGFPLGSTQCQPTVAGWLLLALCDLNIVGQWQKKSNLFHWAAHSNAVWQIWHSIPNIQLEYINLSVFLSAARTRYEAIYWEFCRRALQKLTLQNKVLLRTSWKFERKKWEKWDI